MLPGPCPRLVTPCPGVRSDPQPDQFAVKGPAVRRDSVGSDDAQPSALDGHTPDLVVALPAREQRDVDAMGDGPVADIDTERPGVGDEVPRGCSRDSPQGWVRTCRGARRRDAASDVLCCAVFSR